MPVHMWIKASILPLYKKGSKLSVHITVTIIGGIIIIISACMSYTAK